MSNVFGCDEILKLNLSETNKRKLKGPLALIKIKVRAQLWASVYWFLQPSSQLYIIISLPDYLQEFQ